MKNDLISRQAAIDALMCLVKQHECDLMPDLLHWTGVKAMLESLPSAQPERCEDCGNFNKARLLIPQPERKKGKWIVINESAGLYECDQCHEWSCCVGKYCMHCGSPMEVEERE